MEKWELMVCFKNHTWKVEEVEVVPAQIDGPDDVIESYIENYVEKNGENDIAFVGVYSTQEVEGEE